MACLRFDSEKLLITVLNECSTIDTNSFLIINKNMSIKKHCLEILLQKNFTQSI